MLMLVMGCSPLMAKKQSKELIEARDRAIAAETRLFELRQERMQLEEQMHLPIDSVDNQLDTSMWEGL